MIVMAGNGKVISFINMKGGVGKTTLSMGIADYLAEQNKKTLFIDIDPQFNGTQGLLDYYKKNDTVNIISEREKISKKEALDNFDTYEYNYYTERIKKQHKTIYRLFTPQIELSEEYRSPKNIITTLTDNLDIICGDLNLVLANKSANYDFINRIKNFIVDEKIKEKYDYIIIDCPPTLTIYTDSALYASDYYVIPNRIDRYSITGIDSLQSSVKSLIKSHQLSLRCLGIVYTMVPTDVGKKQSRIQSSFESRKAVNELDIFSSKTHIVNNIQVGITGGTLPTKYQNSREDIIAIGQELIKRINEKMSD